jgi:hypothetical protein
MTDPTPISLGEPTGEPAGGFVAGPVPQVEVMDPVADGNMVNNDIAMEDTANDIMEDQDDPSATSTDNPKFSLHPDDPQNFLKLSNALIIYTKKTLITEDISTADNLLREYCTELITVRLHSLPAARI